MRDTIHWFLFYYLFPFFIWSVLFGVIGIFTFHKYNLLMQMLIFGLIPFWDWLLYRTGHITRDIVRNNCIVLLLAFMIVLLEMTGVDLSIIRALILFPFTLLMELLDLSTSGSIYVRMFFPAVLAVNTLCSWFFFRKKQGDEIKETL